MRFINITVLNLKNIKHELNIDCHGILVLSKYFPEMTKIVINLPLKNYHYMQLPREVIVGSGVIRDIAEAFQRLGFQKSALIIAGSKTYDIAGKTIKEVLEQEGINVDTFLVGTPKIKEVLAIEEKIRIMKPQVVFGVGGGTKIDAAKLGSANQGVQFISVPTAASHDGISSPLSSIKGFEKPYSVMAQAPIAIIADTDIIIEAPWRSIMSGCGDVIAKMTAVLDWKLARDEKSEYYGEYAASLALMSAKLVMQNAELIKPKNKEGLRILLEALISCGVSMSIAGNSRPCSGSEHLFSHALDIINCNHAMHGEKCGVGTIVMAYLHKGDWKRIKDTLKMLGAPTTAYELGIEKDDLIRALEMAANIRPERYTILHKLNLKRKTLENIAKITELL